MRPLARPTPQIKPRNVLVVLTLAALCLANSVASADDYYVTSQSSSYIDFSGSGVGPGDTIYLTPHTRARLALKNLAGTAQSPITITNSGGQFVLYNPNDDYETLRLINCQHVILRGTPGEGYEYGIKVSNSTSTNKTGVDVQVTPTDIEIDGIEVGPCGGAGIKAKDEGAAPPLVFDNLIIHDCYIHDVGVEGMYLGSSNFSSGNEQPLHNCHVYDNIVLDTGWDSIQVGCGTVNTQIHDNICIGWGWDGNKTVQNDGIRGNYGFSGRIYNNWVEGGNANCRSGININAWDDTYVYNNVVLNAGSDGIKFLDDVGSPVTDCDVVIANNTIIEPDGDGIEYWPDEPVGLAINNIIVNPGDDYVYHRYASVDLTETTNLEAATIGSVGFVDAGNDDYSLSASATGAIDQGTNVSSYGITTDIDGISRPQNSVYDIGAYEYVGAPTNQAPNVNAGSDDEITLPASASLDGTVTDDGLPDPPAAVTVTWTKQSGPGTVTFGDDESVDTTASFSAAGTYVLRLTADDNDLNAYDDVTITVNAAQGGEEWTIIEPVDWGKAGSATCPATYAFDDQPTWDDTNEEPDGDDASPHTDTNTDFANAYFYVDLGTDWEDIRIVGTWTRYRPYSGTSNYTYYGFGTMWWDDDTDDTNDGTTETTLDWENPLGGTVPHDSDQHWVQDVDCSASPVTPQGRYLIVGTGANPSSRVNEFCIVGYTVSGETNTAPSVDAGSDDTITLPSNATLDGTVTDDGLPDPPASVSVTWSKQSGPGSVTFDNANAVDTTASFSTDGTYVLRLTADDDDLTAYDEVTITVEAAPTIGIITPVGQGTAEGSSYCAATGAFNAQPTWDSNNECPVGDDPEPHSTTTTAYADRYFYIDFGADYADIRIVGTWTRWRPSSAGDYYGFPAMWWDDDKDTTNDGTSENTLDWANATGVPYSGDQQWIQDVDCSASPITPAGRYLVVSTGSSPTSRCNEFAIIGYTVP